FCIFLRRSRLADAGAQHYNRDDPVKKALMRARVTIAALVACSALIGCDGSSSSEPRRSPSPPSFITHGTLDGNAHPAVVLVVMAVAGRPPFRCSGTALAPKVVLTAGHCAGEPGEFTGMRVFTEADVDHGDNSYPNAGGANTIEATEWHAHPLFTENLFFL